MFAPGQEWCELARRECGKPLKTVRNLRGPWRTQLKLGVNESGPRLTQLKLLMRSGGLPKWLMVDGVEKSVLLWFRGYFRRREYEPE